MAVDASAPAPVLVGSFEGRGGYDAAGSVTLAPAEGGGLLLTLSDDFASAAVPGPALVVTSRDRLGTALTDADTLVTRLGADMIRGPGTFSVPLAAPPEPAWVFVYCEPFGVETARARLEPR